MAKQDIFEQPDSHDLLGFSAIGMIEDIRKEIEHEEFDYQTLMSCLRHYARPRDKVSALLKKGSIIRIKKGLCTRESVYLVP